MYLYRIAETRPSVASGRCDSGNSRWPQLTTDGQNQGNQLNDRVRRLCRFRRTSASRRLDEGGDGVGGAFDSAGRTETLADFGESGAKLFAGLGIVEEAKGFRGDAVWRELGLNEFRNDAALGDEVDHTEEFCPNERFGKESSERSDAVDDDHGGVEESSFDRGGAAGDDGGICGGENVVSLAFDDAQVERRVPARLELGDMIGSGGGDDKLDWFFFRDAEDSLANDGHVLGELGLTGAGENGDERKLRIEIVLTKEIVARLRGLDTADEGMADEFCGDARFGEECFFEGENTEGLREALANDPNTPGTPGPELRTDEIDVFCAVRTEFTGEAEVEAGKVGEDGKARLAAFCFRDEMAHGADERRQVAEDFGDADDGDFGVVSNDVNASGAHLRTAHAEESEVGKALLKSGGEACGVHIPRDFASGDEKRNRRHSLLSGAQSEAG